MPVLNPKGKWLRVDAGYLVGICSDSRVTDIVKLRTSARPGSANHNLIFVVEVDKGVQILCMQGRAAIIAVRLAVRGVHSLAEPGRRE